MPSPSPDQSASSRTRLPVEHAGGKTSGAFPEGMIRVQGTGQSILELCDGQRTVQQIVATLAEKYGTADPVKIKDDVSSFLEALQQKRIVDYE